MDEGICFLSVVAYRSFRQPWEKAEKKVRQKERETIQYFFSYVYSLVHGRHLARGRLEICHRFRSPPLVLYCIGRAFGAFIRKDDGETPY